MEYLRSPIETEGQLKMARFEFPFENEHAAIYSVGQVAEMLGVQPAFLRRLDNENIIQPARSEGGQRRYSQSQIQAVQRIVGLTSEGLNLAGVRRLLTLENQVKTLEQQIREFGQDPIQP